MSDKLQSYKADVTIPVYGTIADAQVYLKSDVDKVLDKFDKLIAYAQDLVLEDIKLIRHQKYKRCLAMAKRCRDIWFLLRFDKEAKKSVFYWRWWNIWLGPLR